MATNVFPMNAYLWYLLYVAAVIAAAILMVRRTGRRVAAGQPDVLEVAWLRGQAGGVMEVVVFDLCQRELAELTVIPGSHKLLLRIKEQRHLQNLTELEQTAVEVFGLIQQKTDRTEARRKWVTATRDLMAGVIKKGWWRKATAGKKILTALVPLLIALGSLKFLNHYQGSLQVGMGVTVLVLAVLGRRLVAGELEGPTEQGRLLLTELRQAIPAENRLSWLVALHGGQIIEQNPQYRSYGFLTRSMPFRQLNG